MNPFITRNKREAQDQDPWFDKFFNSYINTALWVSNDEDIRDNFYGLPGEFDPDTYQFLRDDAKKFFDQYQHLFYDRMAQGGHDYLLTRNGHGAGFWDGSWGEPAATELTKAAEQDGEINLYVGDDGLLYVYEFNPHQELTDDEKREQLSEQIWDATRAQNPDQEQIQELLKQWEETTGTQMPRFLGGVRNPFKKSQVHMNLPVRDQPVGSPYNKQDDAGPGRYSSFGPGDIVEVVPSEAGKPNAKKGDWDYYKALKKLGDEDRVKLGASFLGTAYLERLDNGDIGVKLYDTYIVIYHPDNTFELNTGGWNTITTREFMNDYSPVWVSGENASRGGRAEGLLVQTPWGEIEGEGVLFNAETGLPVEMEQEGLPPHAEDFAGKQGEILYKDEGRSGVYTGNVWKVYFPDTGDVGFYADHSLKMIQPYLEGERLQQEHPAPEIQDEDDIVIASKNPFRHAQELKNDIYNEETEQPSDPESDTGHNLEFVDRSDDKKNNRPTHHQGPVRSAQSEVYIPKDGDRVRFLKDSDNAVTPTSVGDEGVVQGTYYVTHEWISVKKDDGKPITVHVRNIEPIDEVEQNVPAPIDEEAAFRKRRHDMMRQKFSSRNPFGSAQQSHKYKAGDSVIFYDESIETDAQGVVIEAGFLPSGEPGYSIRRQDGTTVHIKEQLIRENEPNTPRYTQEEITPTSDDLDDWYKQSRLNPFRKAQTDQDTAETGHIGNSESDEGPNRGGRTPGDLDNPTPNNPFAHERGENSKGEQIA